MTLGLFVSVVLIGLGGLSAFLVINKSSTSAPITTDVDVFTDAYLATMTGATTRTSLSTTSSTNTNIVTTTAITTPAMLFLSTYSSRNEF